MSKFNDAKQQFDEGHCYLDFVWTSKRHVISVINLDLSMIFLLQIIKGNFLEQRYFTSDHVIS